VRNTLASAVAAVTKGAEALSIVLLIAITALVLYEVGARFLFNAPTIWSQDLSIYLFLWFAFLGLGPTERAGHHIRIDLLHTKLPGGTRRVVEALTYLGVTAFALVAAYYGAEAAMQSLRFGRRALSLFSVPLWIPQLSLAVGMLIMAAEAARRMIRAWRADDKA
jgi:TRAP-type C4-dicarboxylate transport system permease small subunit